MTESGSEQGNSENRTFFRYCIRDADAGLTMPYVLMLELIPVSGAPNFDEFLDIDARFCRSGLYGIVSSFTGSSSSEILLMFFALRVGQVRAFIVVQSQAQFAFIGT